MFRRTVQSWINAVAGRTSVLKVLPIDSVSSGENIPLLLREQIARGRGALARLETHPTTPGQTVWRDSGPVAELLRLLWHEDSATQCAAVSALAGGDLAQPHRASYGHFVGTFLRGLDARNVETGGAVPDTSAARYAQVTAVLKSVLDQNASEIRGMSNMNYSFLSSALYLALLSTCRDAIEAARRLHADPVHEELCRLLWNLAQLSVQRRLNGQDLETLATAAGRALAAFAPDHIPEFWRSLRHASPARRQAVLPALAHFHDARAVPFLLASLPDQPFVVAEPILCALGRLEDARARPALTVLAASPDRQMRAAARNALQNIERGQKRHPSRTMLRAAREPGKAESASMLRAVKDHPQEESPAELLRSLSDNRAE